MSHNNYILNLLNIKDKNVFILTNSIQERIIKGKKYKIIEGILTYNSKFCLKILSNMIVEAINNVIKQLNM